MGVQVNVNFKDVFKVLCEDCQAAVKEMVKVQVQDTAIKELFEGGDDK